MLEGRLLPIVPESKDAGPPTTSSLWEVLRGDQETRVNAWNASPFTEEIVQSLAMFYNARYSHIANIFATKQSSPVWQIAYASKRNPAVGIAAANAVTVLNVAGTSFSGCDFSDTYLPGVDLRHSVCDGANFSGAHLQGAKFKGAWLNNADFGNACLQDADFGERPYFSLEGQPTRCCYSPDGCWLAVSMDNGSIAFFSMADYKLVTLFQAHTGEVTDVSFSPDGQQLVSSSWDTTLRLWNVPTGICMWKFVGHTNYVNGVSFSADGKMVVSSSDDETLRIWSVENGRCLLSIARNEGVGGTISISFAPDGREVVLADKNGVVWLWDLQNNRLPLVLRSHAFMSASFDPACEKVLVGREDGSVQLWDRRGGLCLHTLFKGPVGSITSVRFSPSGHWVASGSRDGRVRVWDVEDGEEGVEPLGVSRRHGHKVMDMSFNPDGTQIASVSDDHTLRFHPTISDACEYTFTHRSQEITSVAFRQNGRQVVSGSADGTVLLWNVDTGVHAGTPGKGEGRVCAFSSDGERVVSENKDHTGLELWKLATDKRLWMFRVEDGHKFKKMRGVVHLSVDGRWIVLMNEDGTLWEWEVATGELLWDFKIEGFNGSSTAVDFSPDGEKIVFASEDGVVRLFEVETGKRVWKSKYHSGVTSLSFSDDGKRIVACSEGGVLALCETEEGKPLGSMRDFSQSFTKISFSPDRKIVAAATKHEMLCLWFVQSSAEKQHFLHPVSSSVTALCWQQKEENLFLATGHEDASVCCWELKVVDSTHHTFRLLWNSLRSHALSAVGADLTGVSGLSDSNRALLEQRGAVAKPLSLVGMFPVKTPSSSGARACEVRQGEGVMGKKPKPTMCGCACVLL